VIAALLAGDAAHAGETLEVAATAATHRGVCTEDGVTWTSELTVELVDDGGVVPLAVPPADGAELVGSAPRGVRLLPDPPGLWVPARSRQVRVTVREPLPELEGDVVLRPPLAAGGAPQRVVLVGCVFEPHADLGAERFVRYDAQPDIDRRTRKALNRMAGKEKRAGRPLYLRDGPELAALGGVPGDLHPMRGVKRSVVLAFGALFAVVVAGLLVLASWPTADRPPPER
jgi:hypothetical protein